MALSMGLPNRYSSLLMVPGPLYSQSTLSSRGLREREGEKEKHITIDFDNTKQNSA